MSACPPALTSNHPLPVQRRGRSTAPWRVASSSSITSSRRRGRSARAGQRQRRHRAAWARSSSTRSTSPAATTTSSCCPGSPATVASGPTPSCTRTGALFEAYNKMLSIVPTAELPLYRMAWDRARDPARWRGLRRARAARRGAARADPLRRAAVLDATSRRGRPSTGTGARRTRSGRSSRRSARPASSGIARRDGNRRVYDLVERLFPAELLDARPDPRDAVPPQAPVAVSRPRPARRDRRARAVRSARRRGSAIGVEDGRRRDRRAAWRCSPSSSRRASCCPSRSKASAATRYVRRRPGRLLRQAERGDRARCAARTVGRPASPSSRRSTRSSGIAISCAGCSTSTTSGRSTSRRRSGAGATTSCRSCTATGSSAGSSRGSSGGPDASAIVGLWWEDGFDPLADDGFVDGVRGAVEAHRAFGGAGAA